MREVTTYHQTLTKRLAQCLVLFLAISLSSCNVSKYISQGESLYTGAKIKIYTDSSFNKKQIKAVNEQLKTIIRPVPNSAVFGFPYKVWFYYVLGEPRKKKSPRQWFRKKFGEAPILASKRAVATNTEIINNYLNNEGYFRSTASGELIINGKKAEALYNVNVKPRYTIGKIEFVKKDSTAFTKHLLQTQENSLLKINDPYRFDNIKLERERIDKTLKLNGYYFFRPDFLIIKVDSNQNRKQVNLLLELKPNILQTSLKQYSIKEILVYVDTPDSTNKSVQVRRGLRVFDPTNAYKAKVFNDAISFRSGRLYSSQTHDASLSRLINLRNFKFVKNRFELVNRSDSALINVIYDLTSLKNKSFQAQLDALTRSNNLAGTQLGINWLNRNIFKGAEILKIGIKTGFDFQLSSKLNNDASLNSYYSLAGDADLTFPRFVLPFYKVSIGRNQALPKTNINIGYSRLVQKGVGTNEDGTSYKYNQYTITSLRSSLSYTLRKKATTEHNFTPLSINLIKPKNISEEFQQKVENSNNIQDLLRYFKILETRLILGGQYNVVYTPKQALNSRHYFYLNAGIDIAGNIAGLLFKKQADDSKRIANTIFEQYARFDVETRYYLDLSPSLRWANRMILGYGLPYGNSKSLPQMKQYFVGGSNSIRAFRARSVGPGDFDITADSAAIFTTAYGDIKLELNTELRLKVTQIINLAAFVDAGNIWLTKYNDASGYPESSVFGKDFYKQLAVGGGLGLRLDFTFVKLRLDLATPFRKPWLPENERWVINKIDPFTKTWRKQNLILNIAVDYPF